MTDFHILVFILICILLLSLILYNIINNNKYDFKNEYSHLSIQNIIKTHEEISKLKNKKNNDEIIFFLSIDYKIMPEYYNTMLKILTKYCKHHNNKLIIFDHSNDKNKISPYWNRVSDFIKLSNRYNESPNVIFVYLDIDTCINSKYFDLSISDMVNSVDYIENKISDIYIGNDSSRTEFGNAGIIVIRNTNWSKQFLNLWWGRYNPENWYIENGNWICKKDMKLCNWAGDGYEQGEFNNLYRENKLDSINHIKILHYSLFSNRSPDSDAFIWHFYYTEDNNRNNYFNKIYNDYVNINILP